MNCSKEMKIDASRNLEGKFFAPAVGFKDATRFTRGCRVFACVCVCVLGVTFVSEMPPRSFCSHSFLSSFRSLSLRLAPRVDTARHAPMDLLLAILLNDHSGERFKVLKLRLKVQRKL